MNTILMRLFALVLCLVLLQSCNKDEVDRGYNGEGSGVEVENFQVLSVKSSGDGQAVSLSLSLNVGEDDELRSRVYTEGGAGDASQVSVNNTEKLNIILRRKGDLAATTYVTIVCKGRRGNKLTFDDLKINLPQGVSLASSDEWYITGMLGGDSFSMQNGRTTMGGTSLEQGERLYTTNADRSVEVPYSFAWRKVSVENGRNFRLPATPAIELTPMGTLLRLHFYSNLLEDYRATKLTISSNALHPTGYFDPMDYSDDELEGRQPKWVTTGEDAQVDVQTWSYRLANRVGEQYQELLLPATQGWSAERTVFVWGMPVSLADNAGRTEVKLQVQPTLATNASTTIDVQTYSQMGHRALKSANTYRLSNMLTSDLLISEVYYQYAPATTTEDGLAHNWSIVEIYNPTASDIDLTNYAVARILTDNDGRNKYFAYSDAPHTQVQSSTAVIPLSMLTSDSRSSVFDIKSTTGQWRKVIYGDASTKLKAGATILLGAGSYVATQEKPSKNIELYNDLLSSNPAQAIVPASVRAIEKVALPRAGMQADSAYKLGYMQAMVAFNNARSKNATPAPRIEAGTLQLGSGQGIALVKATYDISGATPRYSYQVVDATIPVGNASEEEEYRQWLISQLNLKGLSAASSLSPTQEVSYSLVRAKGTNFPSAKVRPTDWVLSASENDGVKSLGTRDYVAGLSPYAHNYTGYSTSNNIKGLPFWSNVARRTTPSRQWADIPKTGDNGTGGSANDVDQYRQISVASATATEQQAAYPIRNSYDGSQMTYYHSRNKSDNPSFPITLTYNFAQAVALDYMLYYPRDKNGAIDDLEVRVVYEDGSTATTLQTSLGASIDASRITWSGIRERKIRSVSFVVKSTGGGVLSVREMEFFGLTDKYFDTSTLFKDLACTELRDGITYEQIMSASNVFFRDIARKLYQGTYPKEFRIADYKAYPQAHLQREANKNQFSYSRLDNPTGISVQAGEELVVLVNESPNFELSIVVQDLEAGYGGDTYMLEPGVNRLKMQNKGLVYLMYNVPQIDIDRTRYPDVRVHFAVGGGTVNGYFDTQNPKHKGRWAELLSKATDKHFDVLGEYAHITYPTAAFRANTPDILPVIGYHDRLVHDQMALMGLFKYGGVFKNRSYFHVNYESKTNSNGYRTTYNETATTNLQTNLDGLRRNPWAMAHEVGHVNQTEGFLWAGMIEVSNNLMALYCMTHLAGQPSRALINDYYQTWWNKIVRDKKPQADGIREGWGALLPFWQLQLYYGKALGRSPELQADKGGFYPALYQRLRTVTHSTDAMTQQAEFAYHASVVAGQDLTDFFVKWGMLSPIQNYVYYNTYRVRYQHTLTEATIASVKARIAALGLPKPTQPIEYISDNNYSLFTNPQPVVPGTSIRRDRTLVFDGWKNVVVFEVKDANGELVYISEGKTGPSNRALFILDKAWVDTYQVYAVSASGDRTLVTF